MNFQKYLLPSKCRMKTAFLKETQLDLAYPKVWFEIIDH